MIGPRQRPGASRARPRIVRLMRALLVSVLALIALASPGCESPSDRVSTASKDAFLVLRAQTQDGAPPSEEDLDAPTLALGQQPTPMPKLTATTGSVFPDRTYMLQLPRRAATPKPFLTENGSPVLNLAISARGGSASGMYVISYRSLLPPQVKAVVRATITGFPAATTTYTTPALSLTASENFERGWMDSRYVTILAIVAIVAVLVLTVFALRTRFEHRD
jgi:hypothetical protein